MSANVHGFMLQALHTAGIRTADGDFVANYSEKGLCGLTFPATIKDSRAQSRPASMAAAAIPALPPRVRHWHSITIKAVGQVLSGRTPRSLPPMDLSSGTDFQRAVWSVLCRIAPGKTLSYGEVAKAVGRPGAFRAVGGACGANPVPLLIPCHRVLAANSRLGGFSGGLHWKRLLLGREGVRFR